MCSVCRNYLSGQMKVMTGIVRRTRGQERHTGLYKQVVGQSEANRHLGDLGVDGGNA